MKKKGGVFPHGTPASILTAQRHWLLMVFDLVPNYIQMFGTSYYADMLRPSIPETVTLPMKFYLIFFYSGNFQFNLFIIGGMIFIQEILLHYWHQGGP